MANWAICRLDNSPHYQCWWFLGKVSPAPCYWSYAAFCVSSVTSCNLLLLFKSRALCQAELMSWTAARSVVYAALRHIHSWIMLPELSLCLLSFMACVDNQTEYAIFSCNVGSNLCQAKPTLLTILLSHSSIVLFHEYYTVGLNSPN